MTVDEAHTKQCCGPVGCGRFNDAPYPARWCVADACMAWRTMRPARTGSLSRAMAFAEEGKKIDAIKALREAVPGYDLLQAKRVVEGDCPWPTEASPAGYCGLAGAPQ